MEGMLPIGWTDIATLLAIAVILAVALACACWALHRHGRQSRDGRGPSEHAISAMAVVFAPVWLALVAAILWMLPLVIGEMRAAEAGDLRWSALAFVGLVTALGGLVSAPLALIRVQTTERQTRTAEQGHMTDRINKAVEQLGAEKTVKRQRINEKGKRVYARNDAGEPDFSKPVHEEVTVANIEVRLGAILSLERIAQDSTTYDHGRDHVRVMEILCAYIRENAPARGARDFPLPEWEPLRNDAGEAEREQHKAWREVRFGSSFVMGSNKHQWAQSLLPPREDIALALHIIGRRDAKQRRVEARWGPEAAEDAEWVFDRPCPELPKPPKGGSFPQRDLDRFKEEFRLWKAELRSYKGYHVDLRVTDLRCADLSGLILSGALLTGAHMKNANLSEARLEGADLHNARLESSILETARLDGADFREAQFTGAFLSEARMRGADLSKANLTSVDLSAARMEAAHLRAAWLVCTEHGRNGLEGTVLAAARLDQAIISGLRFDEYTNLTEAMVEGTALGDVTLRPGAITPEQLATMFGDGSVILPDELKPHRPAHWPKAFLSPHNFNDEWRRWLADPNGYLPPERRAE